MNHWWLRKTAQFLLQLTAAALLVACGGGGGDSGAGFLDNPDPESAPLDAVIAIVAANAEGVADNTLSSENPLTITVTLTRGNGSPIANEAVQLDTSLGTVSPENGSALTNDEGEASFEVSYSGVNGAGTLTASYTENNDSVSESLAIQAVAVNYQLRIVSPSSGETFDESGIDITVNVSNSGSNQNAARVIALTSEVGFVEPDNNQALTDEAGNASFRLVGDGTTGAGVVTASFTDPEGNIYEDVISVTMISTGIGGGGSDPSKIIFVSATPETMALKGSGGGTGISEQAAVVFQVTDSSENGVGGQAVTFELSTDLGGISLQNLSGTTDADGNVTAIVNSGALPTPVRVEARTTVPQLGTIGALSPVLNVSSGIPADGRLNAFYLSPQACDETTRFKTCTDILVSAFDRYGNPAVDGTVINAVTNCGGVGSSASGQSTGSCVIGPDTGGFGRCVITWLAGDMNPNDYRQCADGSPVEVMIYTLGEERFGDNNADGYFSTGESFDDLGEPYLDANGSQTHEPPEFFVDWNSSGAREANTGDSADATSSLYNGTACNPELDSPPADIDTNCSSELIYVWDTINPTPDLAP